MSEFEILKILLYSRRAQVVLESERAEQRSVPRAETACRSSSLLSLAPGVSSPHLRQAWLSRDLPSVSPFPVSDPRPWHEPFSKILWLQGNKKQLF